jgi:hypothetical protein
MKKYRFSDAKISEIFTKARETGYSWFDYINNLEKLETEEKKRLGIQQ